MAVLDDVAVDARQRDNYVRRQTVAGLYRACESLRRGGRRPPSTVGNFRRRVRLREKSFLIINLYVSAESFVLHLLWKSVASSSE